MSEDIGMTAGVGGAGQQHGAVGTAGGGHEAARRPAAGVKAGRPDEGACAAALWWQAQYGRREVTGMPGGCDEARGGQAFEHTSTYSMQQHGREARCTFRSVHLAGEMLQGNGWVVLMMTNRRGGASLQGSCASW